MTKFKLTILILLITAFGVVVSGCVKKPQPAVNVNQPVNTNTSTTTAEVDTSDWKTYRNEEYGFEFKYPGDYVLVKENSLEIIFEKIERPDIPSNQIHIRIYLNQIIEDIVYQRETEINDGIFNLQFEKQDNQDGLRIYSVDSYTDALGASKYSEKIFQKSSNNFILSVQVKSTGSAEFLKLHNFLSQVNIN